MITYVSLEYIYFVQSLFLFSLAIDILFDRREEKSSYNSTESFLRQLYNNKHRVLLSKIQRYKAKACICYIEKMITIECTASLYI